MKQVATFQDKNICILDNNLSYSLSTYFLHKSLLIIRRPNY